MTKSQLRQTLLAQRRRLTLPDWQSRSQNICGQLQALPQFQRAQTVLAYFSHQQEPDLADLVTQNPHKTWGLPRCQAKALIWHTYHPGKDHSYLTPDRFGILTPPATFPLIVPEQVDLLLVPCLAVDQRGYRLGYGGGFYDRLLAQPAWGRVLTLGIVFSFGCLPSLPNQAWDIPLRGYCSEDQVVFL